MHDSAYKNAERFYEKHVSNSSRLVLLDFGSMDFNGSIKPIFMNQIYYGVDIENGPNVDIVMKDRHIPHLPDGFADVIVSSSCFEHDEMFWLTFLEMCRLLRPNGLIYIQAPSNGVYHAYPQDCWRFYLDSWAALAKYANTQGYNIELLEAYIDKSNKQSIAGQAATWVKNKIKKAFRLPVTYEAWEDSVGIFIKN